MLTKIFKANYFIFCGMFLAMEVWLGGGVAVAQAATINASSCQQADVQSAIDLAQTGDIVYVPAGECIWNSVLSTTKSIKLIGAGSDQTIISDGGNKNGLMYLGPNTADCLESPLVVSGFKFTGHLGISEAIRLGGSCSSFKVYDNVFDFIISGQCIRIQGSSYGIIYDNIFNLNQGKFGVTISHGNWAGGSFGDGSWSDASSFGTQKAVYIEKNVFQTPYSSNGIRSFATDAYSGGRFVFRFNNLTNANISMHGFDSSGRQRSVRHWEIYNNKMVAEFYIGNAMQLRGGTGLVFNNDISPISGNPKYEQINAKNYRDDVLYWSGICGQSDHKACSASATVCVQDSDCPYGGTCLGYIDNSNVNGIGYPCRDQVGRGMDGGMGVTQALEPTMGWNNSLPISKGSANILENRDFYNQTESFDGTSGTGVGTFADLPTTCTPNVAYWAIDQGNWNKTPGGEQGVLYKCVSENAWEKYYEPYTYPHPLRLEDVPVPDSLAGDLNSDGTVNIFDYNIFLQNFGATDCGNVADLNGDCNVNIFDYNILLENFGKTI